MHGRVTVCERYAPRLRRRERVAWSPRSRRLGEAAAACSLFECDRLRRERTMASRCAVSRQDRRRKGSRRNSLSGSGHDTRSFGYLTPVQRALSRGASTSVILNALRALRISPAASASGQRYCLSHCLLPSHYQNLSKRTRQQPSFAFRVHMPSTASAWLRRGRIMAPNDGLISTSSLVCGTSPGGSDNRSADCCRAGP